MADADYDALAARLGIPPALVPAWKSQVAPAPAPAPPPGAPPLRPGDPGWTLAPTAKPMVAPSPPPTIGPRPGEQGFDITKLAPPPATPTAPAKPLPVAPSKPLTKAEALKNIQGTNDEIAKVQSMGDKPMLVLDGANAARATDAAKGTEENIKKAFQDEAARKNLEGATFADGNGGAAMGGIAGAGAPFLISPGGRRTAAWQVQEGIPVSDEEKAAAASGDARALTAAGLDYKAGQRQAEHERGYLDRLEAAQANHANEQKVRADAYEQEYSKHVAELDQLRQQIREAKVDPFAGSGGAGRFAGAIAIALGAFGARGGVNQGLEAVKHTISTNILDQEKKVEAMDRGARAEHTFLGTLKAKYGDIEQAKDAAWIGYLEKTKVELAKILGGEDVRDPQLQAKYERMIKATDDELEHRLASWDARTRDRVIRHDVNAPPQYGGGVDMKHAREDAKWLAEHYDAAKIPESLATLEGVDQTIDTFGNGDIPGVGPVMGHVPNWAMSDRAVAARQKWQGVKNQIGHGLYGGALSPTEAENLSKQLDGAHDAASLRRVVQDFRTTLHHKQRNLAGGASPGGKLLYGAQGGSVGNVPIDRPASPYIREPQ